MWLPGCLAWLRLPAPPSPWRLPPCAVPKRLAQDTEHRARSVRNTGYVHAGTVLVRSNCLRSNVESAPPTAPAIAVGARFRPGTRRPGLQIIGQGPIRPSRRRRSAAALPPTLPGLDWTTSPGPLHTCPRPWSPPAALQQRRQARKQGRHALAQSQTMSSAPRDRPPPWRRQVAFSHRRGPPPGQRPPCASQPRRRTRPSSTPRATTPQSRASSLALARLLCSFCPREEEVRAIRLARVMLAAAPQPRPSTAAKRAILNPACPPSGFACTPAPWRKTRACGTRPRCRLPGRPGSRP